jgi:putative endonuclease
MAVKDAVGRYGERVAARHVQAAGWAVLARNWRSPSREVRGEIDMLALDGDTLVVVEVKTRRSASHGSGLEAVTPEKLRRLRRLAAVWLAGDAGRAAAPAAVRIDVVAVRPASSGSADVLHVRGVG